MIWMRAFEQVLTPEQQHVEAWKLLEQALDQRGLRLNRRQVHYSPHGKPYFASGDIHFNLTHAPQLVAVALHHQPVGIDVEYLRDYRTGALHIAFSAKEQVIIQRSPQPNLSFFSRWCLKESQIKRKAETVGKQMQQLCYEDYFSWEVGQACRIEAVSPDQMLIQRPGHILAVSGLYYENAQQLERRLHCL